jgi:hypothetical protein
MDLAITEQRENVLSQPARQSIVSAPCFAGQVAGSEYNRQTTLPPGPRKRSASQPWNPLTANERTFVYTNVRSFAA